MFLGSLREIGRCEASKVHLPSSFSSPITLYHLYPLPYWSLWSALWLFSNTIHTPHTPLNTFSLFPTYLAISTQLTLYSFWSSWLQRFSTIWIEAICSILLSLSAFLTFPAILHLHSFSLFSTHPLSHYPINLILILEPSFSTFYPCLSCHHPCSFSLIICILHLSCIISYQVKVILTSCYRHSHLTIHFLHVLMTGDSHDFSTVSLGLGLESVYLMHDIFQLYFAASKLTYNTVI